MPDLPKNVLYYGREEALPERVVLRAGPLSMVLEDGALRAVRLGDREVLRGIYAAVRDHNWDTVPAALSALRVDARQDSFHVSFTADHRQGDVDFSWNGTIRGGPDGTVRFVFDGEARNTFRRNRIGFCVLHPGRECAGAPCRVGHADGRVEETAFPRLIAPFQPFVDVRSISHRVDEGLWATVAFEGDVFETEDQRNWTDASFKTYSTPLRIPYPVEIPRGSNVRQAVTLTLEGAVPPPTGASAGAADDVVSVRLVVPTAPPNDRPLPPIGLGVATHGRPLAEAEVRRLRALNLSHLRAEVALHRAEWEADLRRAAEQAAAVGVPLELAVFVSDAAEAELAALGAAWQEFRPRVRTWLVFHHREKSTSHEWVALARGMLAHLDPAARFAGGSNAYFTELNRGRPPMHALDAVVYSINPQVHAFDNATLAEALEAQGATVESARALAGGKPVIVSPVTLRPRFNPDATGPDPEPPAGELPRQVDMRQMSLFGAGWTLGTLKSLAEAGAESITFYETTGWRGVMEEERGSPLPRLFRSLPGSVFPMYHLLADAGEFSGGEAMRTAVEGTPSVAALTLVRGGHSRTLVANLEPRPRRVVLRIVGQTLVRKLDETNVIEAMTRPDEFRRQQGAPVLGGAKGVVVDLLPYAVARVDSGL